MVEESAVLMAARLVWVKEFHLVALMATATAELMVSVMVDN